MKKDKRTVHVTVHDHTSGPATLPETHKVSVRDKDSYVLTFRWEIPGFVINYGGLNALRAEAHRMLDGQFERLVVKPEPKLTDISVAYPDLRQ
jgi:hypothetical protein